MNVANKIEGTVVLIEPQPPPANK